MRRHPRRLSPAEYQGFRLFFLTICTHQRARAFDHAATVEMVVSQFLRVARDEQLEILAYCVMPDHLHAVVSARSGAADLRRFVRIAKQRSGFAFTRSTGAPLWQESYFDRTIRSQENLPALIEYMLRNPVRAGLVAEPTEYPYWGSGSYSREELLDFAGSAPGLKTRGSI